MSLNVRLSLSSLNMSSCGTILYTDLCNFMTCEVANGCSIHTQHMRVGRNCFCRFAFRFNFQNSSVTRYLCRYIRETITPTIVFCICVDRNLYTPAWIYYSGLNFFIRIYLVDSIEASILLNINIIECIPSFQYQKYCLMKLSLY